MSVRTGTVLVPFVMGLLGACGGATTGENDTSTPTGPTEADAARTESGHGPSGAPSDGGIASGGSVGSAGTVATGGRRAGTPMGGTGGLVGSGGVAPSTGGVAVSTGGVAGSAAADAGAAHSSDGRVRPCEHGATCDQNGATCVEAETCCPCTLVCEDGSWEYSACARCMAPVQCPEAVPVEGEPCAPCDRLVGPCDYQDCQGLGRISALCRQGLWEIFAEPCPAPCGTGADAEPCDPGFICVADGGLVPSFTCQLNPCGSEPVSCDCAGELCTVGTCVDANADRVSCVCLTCSE